MPGRPVYQLNVDEAVARLRELAQSRGEGVTRRELCQALGIDATTLMRHCGCWRDLRAAAGLQRPCARRPPDVSDDTLIEEYRRIVKQLGRPPREAEFDRLSSTIRYSSLVRRLGDPGRRARIRDEFEQTFGTRPMTDLTTDVPWDEAWLRELWPRVRIGHALRSSDLREGFLQSRGSSAGEAQGLQSVGLSGASTPYDVIFCAVHDWPTAPVPVLVASQVLGERAQQPPVSQP
jgi:hypothetical protein